MTTRKLERSEWRSFLDNVFKFLEAKEVEIEVGSHVLPRVLTCSRCYRQQRFESRPLQRRLATCDDVIPREWPMMDAQGSKMPSV